MTEHTVKAFDDDLDQLRASIAEMGGLADGPTEAHKVNLARQLFRDYEADDPEWPTEFLGRRREAARARYGHMVASVPSVPDRVPPFVPLPQP